MLNSEGAAHCLDRARELGQEPVADCLDDPAAMPGDGRIDRGIHQVLEARVGKFLVLMHEARVTSDIGTQYDSEPARLILHEFHLDRTIGAKGRPPQRITDIGAGCHPAAPGPVSFGIQSWEG